MSGTRSDAASGPPAGAPTLCLGDDSWGRWLRDRLEHERVETFLFALVPDAVTPVAIVALSSEGEPRHQLYGEAIGAVVGTLGEPVVDAIEAAAGLYFSSNTLVGEEEREVTMRARERALELGRPVVFDPNLRLERWRSRAEAAAASNACVPVRSTIGAGDVLTGLLLARLATLGFYPAAVAASLPEAVAESALACERWGALE